MDNSRKIPLGKSLQQIARQKALDHIHATGQPLPGKIVSVKGSIVKIAFDVTSAYNLPKVIIPIIESLYSRGGHQVGDKGYAAAAAVTTTNASGLGPEAGPGLAKPGNLAGLQWHPLGHAQWPDTGGKRIVQGLAGAVAMTLDQKNQVAALPGKVVLQAGGVSVALKPQDIAKLAKLLSALCMGGGGGGASGGGDGSNTSAGTGLMAALVWSYLYAQPTSGATVSMQSDAPVTIVDPAGTLASLTVVFPSSPEDGQVQLLTFTQSVTTLTLSGVAAAGPTSATPGSRWTFQYAAVTGQWFLI